MTKPISIWQKEIADAANARFPRNSTWSQQDRLLSIFRQLADVTGAVQKEQGIYPSDDAKYEDANHRIAALIADILILCDTRKLDLEAELGKVMDWYKSGTDRNCCVCQNKINMEDQDCYSIEIHKIRSKERKTVWAHRRCLSEAIPCLNQTQTP